MHRDRALMVARVGAPKSLIPAGQVGWPRGGARRAIAAVMRTLPRFQLLPLLLATALGGAACTDDDGDPPKLVSVANQTDAAHTVTFGGTAFGSVAADTTTDYLEVDDGTQVLILDGNRVWDTELGSDNVGGSWTLYLQGDGNQISYGVALDQ
jgi:hypothetical protein